MQRFVMFISYSLSPISGFDTYHLGRFLTCTCHPSYTLDSVNAKLLPISVPSYVPLHGSKGASS